MEALSGFLPDDIIINIISRLPVKSITRFKSVSRQWLSLIRSPFLIATHLRYSSPPTTSFLLCRFIRPPITNSTYSLLLQNDAAADLVVNDVETPFHCGGNSQIAGCCNGAICFTLSSADTRFLLWNPATRESKRIPQPIGNLSPFPFSIIPPIGISIGFAFDRYLDEYKLIKVVYFSHKDINTGNYLYVIKVGVFTRSTDSWRSIIEEEALSEIENVNIEPCPSIVLNGVIYWKGIDMMNKFPTDPHEFVISFDVLCDWLVSFDVEHERFRKISFPSKDPMFWSWNLLAWRESVLVFGHRKEESNTMFDVWRMNESISGGGENWIKLFSIGPFLQVTRPIVVGRDGKVMIQTLVGGETDSMIFYDLNSRQVTNVGVIGGRFIYKAHNYVESLVTF